MALTTDDVNAVIAQWEEWTADAGFRLVLEVKARGIGAGVDVDYDEWPGEVAARFEAESLYVQVDIVGRLGTVFSERVPYDAGMLRASVTVLARTIAGYNGAGEGEGEDG